MPEYYGPWQTAYKRFAQWQENGKLKELFEQLREGVYMQDISIDGTYIKAHRASVGAKKGDMEHAQNQSIAVSRGGRSSEIHAVVDGLGDPLVLLLTGGQVNDSVMMQPALDELDIQGSTVLTDKAYDSWENREYIANRDADLCIPPKSNATDPWYCDYIRYKERHLVGCLFMKIKDYRCIVMRFKKLAKRFL